MSKIVKVIGREIIDSRGNPTVEAEVHGRWFRRYGSCSVRCFYWFPRSAGTARWRQIPFLGKGVTKAVAAVNGPIAQAILGKDAKDQAGIDKIMIDLDGTENKSNFGANAIGRFSGERQSSCCVQRPAAVRAHR